MREIRDTGGRTEAHEADLYEPGTIPELFDRAGSAFGPVTALVNNAAFCAKPPGTVFDAAASAVDRHFIVNVRAPLLLIGEFARRRQERGGERESIINVSTDAARNFSGQLSYGASKSSLEVLTRAVAVELRPSGITVNAVVPGSVQTGYISRKVEERLLPKSLCDAPEDRKTLPMLWCSLPQSRRIGSRSRP
jgi:3-oxoacyl-[acyl-carrier protein] reductase